MTFGLGLTLFALGKMYMTLTKLLVGGPGRKEKINQIIRDLSLPQISLKKLFCAGSAWDEAAAWLVLTQKLSALPHLLWTVSGQLMVYFVSFLYARKVVLEASYRTKFAAESTNTSEAYPLIYYLANVHRDFSLPEWSSFFFLSFLIFLMLSLTLMILTIMVPLLIRAHFLGFGGEGWEYNLLVDISIRKAPPGVSRWRGYVAAGRGLSHSRLYDNEDCITDIANWMNRKLNLETEKDGFLD